MANYDNKHFLDQAGLLIVWTKIKSDYVDNNELAAALANYEKIEDLQRDYFNKTQIADIVNSIYEDINKKVDKEVTSTSGKALIFNESDGGGAKFEHVDGTNSFVGVNNGGASGIAAQVYAVDKNTLKGTKLDVTKNGIFYTTGENSGLPASQRDVAENEIVVKRDIKDIAGGMHFIGVGVWVEGSTIEAMIEAVYISVGKTYADRKAGDLVILKSDTNDREFICDSNKEWIELGDQGLYATKAELAAEASTRETADDTLQANIDAEATTRAAEDAKKVDKEIVGTAGKALIFNEADGGGAKFENNNGVESFVGVNDGSNGIVAQIYADKLVDGKWQGAKLDVKHDGIYYTVGNQSAAERDVASNKLAVAGDLAIALSEEEIKAIIEK